MSEQDNQYDITTDCREGLSVIQGNGPGGTIMVLSGDLCQSTQLKRALEENPHILDGATCQQVISECSLKVNDDNNLTSGEVSLSCSSDNGHGTIGNVLLVSPATQSSDGICELDTAGNGQETQDGILYIHTVPSSLSSDDVNGSIKNTSKYECGFAGGCGKTFSTSAHLKYHTRTHTGEKPFLCSYEGCGRTFTSSGHLKYHQSTHSGDKPFKCQHPGCDRVFAWPAHLKYHMKTHLGDRPFKCSYDGCGKSFYVLQRLNVHIRVHTGERPYMCEVPDCQKSFTTAGNLKNHMRIHTGERPYTCPFVNCSRTFTEHSSLRKHKLTHTGEKPYVCVMCGKTFSQSGSRNAHQRRHNLWQQHKGSQATTVARGTMDDEEDDVEMGQHEPQHIDSGEEHDQNHELIYSTSVSTQTTTPEHQCGLRQPVVHQCVLSQPVVAKEVSIETTPVHGLHAVVQNAAEELIVSQHPIPSSSVSVVSLAESVAAVQQAGLIQSMLDGTVVIPTSQSGYPTSQSGYPTSQTGSGDELSVVDHVLHQQDVEQMMQSVVSQQILNGQIQLPISEPLGSHDHQTTLTTVGVPCFIGQTEHAHLMASRSCRVGGVADTCARTQGLKHQGLLDRDEISDEDEQHTEGEHCH